MGMQVGGKGRFMADVNVTPFVDVMLVLLIIFMVTAPMMTQGLEVDLPQTRAVSVLPKDSESVVLTVKADGALFLDKYQVELGDLEGQVRQLVTSQKKQLFLRADQAVPYGTVVKVMVNGEGMIGQFGRGGFSQCQSRFHGDLLDCGCCAL